MFNFFDPNMILQSMRQQQMGQPSYGMPTFFGQLTNYNQISPWERQNRYQLGYQPGQDYGNTPNPIRYTDLFAMTNPFYGSPRAGTRMPTPASPAALYGMQGNAPGGPMDSYRQALNDAYQFAMQKYGGNETYAQIRGNPYFAPQQPVAPRTPFWMTPPIMPET